jgi:hypothetical protein
MWKLGRLRLTIPQRLLLLTIIPIAGLIVLGQFSFRTYYSQYHNFADDAATLRDFRVEVEEFVSLAAQVGTERDAALDMFARREAPEAQANYRTAQAATDKAVAALNAKLDRLSTGPNASVFAAKAKEIRSFFAAQLPDARKKTTEGSRPSGEVFQTYAKLNYTALFVSECYRQLLRTPEALNVFDAILALQKLHQQDILVTSLLRHGLAHGGLQREELAVLRRQYFIATENEYYLLKFQPALRAFYKAEVRKTDDDAALYQYSADVAGMQMEKEPLPAPPIKAASIAEVWERHFKAYPSVYEHGFRSGEEALLKAAALRRHRAYVIGGCLIGGIVFSLGVNLAINRSTRRALVSVTGNVADASGDVKAASTQLAQASTHISENAAQYASAIDQISDNLQQIFGVADSSKIQAESAIQTTRRARDAVDQGLGTIQELDTAMVSARNSGQRINHIIARINDLSFQTNLLALNAAVEAARAGEAGAGFAVVAGEVRRLAADCADAARETAELIGESSKDTTTAISKSDALAGRFKEVSRSIHEITEIVNSISANLAQQALSIGQINQSVAEQRDVAQGMLAAAEQTASTAISMDGQVESLKASVRRLDVLLGRSRPTETATSAA